MQESRNESGFGNIYLELKLFSFFFLPRPLATGLLPRASNGSYVIVNTVKFVRRFCGLMYSQISPPPQLEMGFERTEPRILGGVGGVLVSR